MMDEDLKKTTELQIAALENEHRALDDKINAHIEAQDLDELSIARLKKQKLKIKDAMYALMASITPDIPA